MRRRTKGRKKEKTNSREKEVAKKEKVQSASSRDLEYQYQEPLISPSPRQTSVIEPYNVSSSTKSNGLFDLALEELVKYMRQIWHYLI